MDKELYNKILSSLQSACSKREYCESEVLRKARKMCECDNKAADEAAKKSSEESAEKILEELKKDRFVDNLRYASAYAREKSSIAGWGKMKISHMLSLKGISKDIVNQALSEIDADKASSKLRNVIMTKYKSLASDPKCREKLLRFALGRGYGWDEAKDLIDSVMSLKS